MAVWQSHLVYSSELIRLDIYSRNTKSRYEAPIVLTRTTTTKPRSPTRSPRSCLILTYDDSSTSAKDHAPVGGDGIGGDGWNGLGGMAVGFWFGICMFCSSAACNFLFGLARARIPREK